MDMHIYEALEMFLHTELLIHSLSSVSTHVSEPGRSLDS